MNSKIPRTAVGFTLIELMVVISIISVLASIIVVSLSSAREKGRIGGGTYFASHSFEKIGFNALGWWKLNETSGNVAHDQSVNNLNLTISGNAIFVPNSNELGSAASLLLDGTSYARLAGITGVTQYMHNGGITISAWIKVTNPTGEQNIVEVDDQSGNLIEKLSLELSGTQSPSIMGWWNNINLFNGSYTMGIGYYYPMDSLWHQITFVFGPDQYGYIYVDGHVLARISQALFKNPTYQVGTVTLGQGVIGYLSDVIVYDELLTAQEVNERYLAELPSHLLVSR